VRRRQFITLFGSAAAWPLTARAQQPERMRRVGILLVYAESDPEGRARVAVFQHELEKLGWLDGRNVHFEVRWASADPEHMRTYAAELVGLGVDIIFTSSNQVTTILSQQTRTIPIVFAAASDPLETGLISSMAHPGGNITGFSQFELAMSGKWLELLKEAEPRLNRVAVLHALSGPSQPGYVRVIDGLAPSLGIQITSAPVRDLAEIEHAINAFSVEANGGLIVLSTPLMTVYREQIIALAARHRLPAIYPARIFATDGGMMSYAANVSTLFQRAASYVDRILKGEKPGDLPVEAPTKFELVINLKTVKALGLTVPPSLLAIADEVIE
jgi:putative ABC transport system substrate-binding protein